MNLRCLCLALIGMTLASVVGCADTRTYDISLKNDASRPVVAWLTKTGGPYEPLWRSPEDFAIEKPGGEVPRTGGVYLNPGETATVGPVTGKFDSGVDAVLRVYLNARSMNDLLAIGPSSPNRADIVLHPGTNSFVVSDKIGKLTVGPPGSGGVTSGAVPSH